MASRDASSVVGVVLSLALAGSAAAQIEFRTVATQGSGAPGGGVFGDFATPILAEDGSIAIANNVNSLPATMATRLFVERDGVLSLIAAEGMPAPGAGSGETFSQDNLLSFSTPSFSVDGALYFDTLLQGASVTDANDEGLWVVDGVSVELVVREGDDLSAILPGTAIGSIDERPIDASRVAFFTTLTGAGVTSENDGALLLEDNGVLSVVFREGSQAPGFAAGVVINNGAPFPDVTASGAIIATGRLAGEGILSSNNDVLWGGLIDAPVALLQEGDPVPGFPGDTVFRSFEEVAISSNGTRAFEARIGTDFRSSIWLFDGASPTLVVDTATAAVPGVGGDAVFTGVARVGVDNAGNVAFTGTFSGTGIDSENNTGAFFYTADGVGTLIAREGSDAPGAAPGDVFTDLAFPTTFEMSSTGQIVIEEILTGPNITIDNDRGLWMTDANGDLQLVVRDGDQFDIDDDPDDVTLRTIRNINYGRQAPTAQGEIAFTLRYTNFITGVFTATIEPPVTGGDCPGDVTGDNAVDLADLNLVLANFGQTTASGDATGDGVVDLTDLNAVLAAFGTGC